MPQETHIDTDLLRRVLQLDPVALDEARRLLPWSDRGQVDRCETNAFDLVGLESVEAERDAAVKTADAESARVKRIVDEATAALRSVRSRLPADVSAGLGNDIDAAIARINDETWSMS